MTIPYLTLTPCRKVQSSHKSICPAIEYETRKKRLGMDLECQNLERRLALGLELSLEWEKLKLEVGLGDK